MSYLSFIKNIPFIAGLICIAALFASCLSDAPVVLNDSIPAEESAQIYFYPGLEITSYNGTAVKTKYKFLGAIRRSTWRNMILPAGEMAFKASGEFSSMNNTYVAPDLTFSHTFEPGVYTILFVPGGIEIYSDLPPKVSYPSRKKLIRTINTASAQN